MSTDDPRAGSYAALDKRVERIEQRQDDQAKAMASLSSDLRVLQSEQHANAGSLAAANAKLDRLLDAQASSNTLMADPEATPAGRLLLKEIAEAQAAAKIATAKADSVALRMAAVAGALAVVVFIANLLGPVLGPLIRQVLNLP